VLNSVFDALGGKQVKVMVTVFFDESDLRVEALVVKAAKFEESDLQRGTHGRRLPPDCL